jgi:hypothetical protein
VIRFGIVFSLLLPPRNPARGSVDQQAFPVAKGRQGLLVKQGRGVVYSFTRKNNLKRHVQIGPS